MGKAIGTVSERDPDGVFHDCSIISDSLIALKEEITRQVCLTEDRSLP